MRKTVALILCVLGLLALSACGDAGESKTFSGNGNADGSKSGESLSAIMTSDFSGASVDRTVFKGCKITMVNVWGTYCQPCIQEMPSLGKLAAAFGEDFQIIGIPVDVVDRSFEKLPAMMEKAEEIIKRTGADYRHILPSKSLQNALLYKAFSIPATVFVNSEGTVVSEMYFGIRSEDEWRGMIEYYLEKEK